MSFSFRKIAIWNKKFEWKSIWFYAAVYKFIHFFTFRKWSVIYFENHFINVDGMANTLARIHTFWLVFVVISIGTGFSACCFPFILFPFWHNTLFPFGWNRCANFNCDLSLYSLVNCNIWRMYNVMHERIEEKESKKEKKKSNTIVNSLRNQIKFNIERPHATYFQYIDGETRANWILYEYYMNVCSCFCLCWCYVRVCLCVARNSSMFAKERKQKENSHVKRFN